jgi:hypothetical protein
MESKTYDKCWIQVEANSPEEALALVKANPEDYDMIDSKCIDISENEFVDEDQWEVSLC